MIEMVMKQQSSNYNVEGLVKRIIKLKPNRKEKVKEPDKGPDDPGIKKQS